MTTVLRTGITALDAVRAHHPSKSNGVARLRCWPARQLLAAILCPILFSAVRAYPATNDSNPWRIAVSNDSDLVNGDTKDLPSLLKSPGADGISLREALLAAEGTTGPKLVTFAANLKGAAIRIGSAGFQNYRQPRLISGDTTISGDIDGDGVADVVIDGTLTPQWSPLGTAFHIYSSSNTIAHLIVSNFHGIAISMGLSGQSESIRRNTIISNIIYQPNVAGAHAISISYGGGDLPGRRNCMYDMSINRNYIAGDVGVSGAYGSSSITISNVLIQENTIMLPDRAIVIQGGASGVSQGKFSSGDSNVIQHVLITDNHIEGTSGVFVTAGDSGASFNTIQDILIASNTMANAALGVMVTCGDTSSDFQGWTNPVVFTRKNLIRDVKITDNRLSNCWEGVIVGSGEHHDNTLRDILIQNNIFDHMDQFAVGIGTGSPWGTLPNSAYNNLICSVDIRRNFATNCNNWGMRSMARKRRPQTRLAVQPTR